MSERELSGGDDESRLTSAGGMAEDSAAARAKAAKDAGFERDALSCLGDVTRFARALARNAADADDLVQETFLRAYEFWNTFTPESNARAWLVTICRNIFLRKKRRDKVVVNAGDDAEVETLAAVRLHNQARDAGLDDVFTRFDLGPAIERAIAALPDVYRIAVQLIDVEGSTYDEVAAALEVPIGTVRSRLFRGRRLLQQDLIEYARDAGFAVTRPAPDVHASQASRQRSEGK